MRAHQIMTRQVITVAPDSAIVDAAHKMLATHLSVNTMGVGLRTVDEHLAALAAVAGNIRV